METDFQYSSCGGHAGFLIRTILAILDLQVTPIFLATFDHPRYFLWSFESICLSVQEKRKIKDGQTWVSKWQSSWISDLIFAIFELQDMLSRPRYLSWMHVIRRSRVLSQPTFIRGDWPWNIFYGHSLPSADSQKAVVSFWRKNVHNTG